MGYIATEDLLRIAESMGKSGYGQYLIRLAATELKP